MTLYKKKYRIESIRRWNWDYTGDGMYFITICTRHRYPYFGRVVDGVMRLSDIGLIADFQWKEVPSHYENVAIDEFIVMPDHLHAIVAISGPKKAPRLITRGAPMREPLRSPEAGSLSNVIRQYKAGVARWCNKAGVDFAWQAGFYDCIIDQSSLEDAREYIRRNPENWSKEQEMRTEHEIPPFARIKIRRT
jgi:REP element-mobilizing transposase RayT